MPPLPGTIAQPIRPIVFGNSPATATVPLVQTSPGNYAPASVPYAPIAPLSPAISAPILPRPASNGAGDWSDIQALQQLNRDRLEAITNPRSATSQSVTKQVPRSDPTGSPVASNTFKIGQGEAYVELYFGYYYRVANPFGGEPAVADVPPERLGGEYEAPVEVYFGTYAFGFRRRGFSDFSYYDFSSLQPLEPVQWRVFFRPSRPGAPQVPVPTREPLPPGGTPPPYLDPAPSVPDYLPYNPTRPGEIVPYQPGGVPVPSERPGFPETEPGRSPYPGEKPQRALPGTKTAPRLPPGKGSPRPKTPLPSPNPWEFPQTQTDEDLDGGGGSKAPTRPKDPGDCCEEILEALKKQGCRFRVNKTEIPIFKCVDGVPQREPKEVDVAAEVEGDDDLEVASTETLYQELAEQIASIREGNFGCGSGENVAPTVIYEGSSSGNTLIHRIELESNVKSVIVIITGTLPNSLSFYKTSAEAGEVEAKFGNIGVAVETVGGAFAWDSKPGWLWTRRTYYQLPETSLSSRVLRLTLKPDLSFVVYDSGER